MHVKTWTRKQNVEKELTKIGILKEFGYEIIPQGVLKLGFYNKLLINPV